MLSSSPSIFYCPPLTTLLRSDHCSLLLTHSLSLISHLYLLHSLHSLTLTLPCSSLPCSITILSGLPLRETGSMLQILLTRYHGPTWDKNASKEETDTGSWASLMNAIKWDATNARSNLVVRWTMFDEVDRIAPAESWIVRRTTR